MMTDAEEPKASSPRRTRAGCMLLVVCILAVPFALAWICLPSFFVAFEIEGPSMEPSLINGDRVLALNLGAPGAEIEAGDVVIYTAPIDGVSVVKRVIGMPGDSVEMRHGEIFVNGKSIAKGDAGPCKLGRGADDIDCHVTRHELGKHTFFTSAVSNGMYDPTPTKVPPGRVYVLGDHLDHSNDSRNPMVGPIAITSIKGIALWRYWSERRNGAPQDKGLVKVP